MSIEVIYTNGIPICPNCKKPTFRTNRGASQTLMYFPEVYNENGVNTNIDMNTITYYYVCNGCGLEFSVSGNVETGFGYTKTLPSP